MMRWTVVLAIYTVGGAAITLRQDYLPTKPVRYDMLYELTLYP